VAILVDNFSGTPFEGRGLRIELDYQTRTDCQPVYIGYAEPGSATSEPVWKIMFCEYDNGPSTGCLIRRRFALDPDGRANFTNVYDDRTSLTYG
jgi:hypothetical protein